MSNNQDQINSKDFLIGTLIGGIVGASIALLWAPKSGKELRTNLNEQALIAKEKGGKLAENAKQKSTILLDKVKNVSFCTQPEDNIEEIENEEKSDRISEVIGEVETEKDVVDPQN